MFKKGRTFWKFNNSLLKDTTFVNLVKQIIIELKKEYAALVYDFDNISSINDDDLVLTIDDQLFFEMILLKIRGKCISYSTLKKKRQETKLEELLIKEIQHLEESPTGDNVHVLEQKHMELRNLRNKKLEGMIIRARARWLFEGEKNSKYFCNLEQRHIVTKSLCVLLKKMMALFFKTQMTL